MQMPFLATWLRVAGFFRFSALDIDLRPHTGSCRILLPASSTGTVTIVGAGGHTLTLDRFGSTQLSGSEMRLGTIGGSAIRLGSQTAPNVLDIIQNNSSYGLPATFRCPPNTPAQITADQNNYAPGTSHITRISTDATRTVTGWNMANFGGVFGEIWNVGSFNLVLAHESASSTAANRFICPGAVDCTLAPNEAALIRYDNTTARWRVFKL